MSTLLLAGNVSIVQRCLVECSIPSALRLLSFVPSILVAPSWPAPNRSPGRGAAPSPQILAIMPEIVLRLTYATSTEKMLNIPLLRTTVTKYNRRVFVQGLTGIFTAFLLSRDDENNLQRKIALLRERRAAGAPLAEGRLDENEEARVLDALPKCASAHIQVA
jgi:hypothetical protein